MWIWEWFWALMLKMFTGRSGERPEEGKKKKVVVVGGGVGGSFVAYHLQSCADVTLVDMKEYFEIPWATVRASVDLSFAERSLVNHTEFLSEARIITSSAINVTESDVTIANGKSLQYDYLVIATGHVGYAGTTRAEKLTYYQTEFEKVKSANSILIAGGGPTGVELAAEIVGAYPEKKLTLVHRGSRLLEFIGVKASQKTFDWLTSKKVEVVLNQSIDLSNGSDGLYQTSGGETIKADCYFLCTGLPMGSSWLKDTVFKDCLDIQGRLMVDDKMRVRGYTNVFAVGDITDIPEMKLGYLAKNHASVTAKNIKLLLKSGNENKMASYRPGSAIAVVSLGRKEAVAQFPFLTMFGRIPGLVKSGDLFLGKTRKELGLKPHLEPAKEQKKQGEQTPLSASYALENEECSSTSGLTGG